MRPEPAHLAWHLQAAHPSHPGLCHTGAGTHLASSWSCLVLEEAAWVAPPCLAGEPCLPPPTHTPAGTLQRGASLDRQIGPAPMTLGPTAPAPAAQALLSTNSGRGDATCSRWARTWELHSAATQSPIPGGPSPSGHPVPGPPTSCLLGTPLWPGSGVGGPPCVHCSLCRAPPALALCSAPRPRPPLPPRVSPGCPTGSSPKQARQLLHTLPQHPAPAPRAGPHPTQSHSTLPLPHTSPCFPAAQAVPPASKADRAGGSGQATPWLPLLRPWSPTGWRLLPWPQEAPAGPTRPLLWPGLRHAVPRGRPPAPQLDRAACPEAPSTLVEGPVP